MKPKSTVAALILAAGQGKRMRSKTPKILHTCLEQPLVAHVVRLALARRCSPIVVVVDPKNGPKVEASLREAFPDAPLVFAVQEKPRGTGDAARAGLLAIPRFSGRLFILYGDVPLLRAETVSRLAKAAARAPLALVTAELANPTGYGRIVRDGDRVTKIVEHVDATPDERAIREINAGVYFCDSALVRRTMARMTAKNAQQEFYLTDIVAAAAAAGGAIAVRADEEEVLGVNTRAELWRVESIMHRRLIAEHQARGVMFRDPQHTVIGANVRIAADVEIGSGVQLYGDTRIDADTRIDGPTVIRNSVIAHGVEIASFCHIEGATIASGARVGPFARLRTGAKLEESSHVGNFVELKKTRLGKGAKANHLAYLGDATIGEGSNIGAGTITCNYDGGPVKHPTTIGKGAFIGSNSTLVAPVRIGETAYVAAGSTVTKDVPNDALAFGRARQENRLGYAERLRARIRDAAKGAAAAGASKAPAPSHRAPTKSAMTEGATKRASVGASKHGARRHRAG